MPKYEVTMYGNHQPKKIVVEASDAKEARKKVWYQTNGAIQRHVRPVKDKS